MKKGICISIALLAVLLFTACGTSLTWFYTTTETPQKTAEDSTSLTCALTVRCDSILDHMQEFNPEKIELVPEDGIIFSQQKVEFIEGESVADVLKREMKQAGIHLEFVQIPMYQATYIKAINNIYEHDCGELSGWMYKVNGEMPDTGCAQTLLNSGDTIEIIYTCDFGDMD